VLPYETLFLLTLDSVNSDLFFFSFFSLLISDTFTLQSRGVRLVVGET
jgi:hypothetical protein